MSEPQPGQVIAGRYRIVRKLAGGGMGAVYLATQEPLSREVALKVVRRDLSGDALVLERFRREALALSRLHHPHIVTLLDFGTFSTETSEVPVASDATDTTSAAGRVAMFFAMELVHGQTLRSRLRARGPMRPTAVCGLLRQCASALDATHAVGIIHRDIKPENILLLDSSGLSDFVKIVDFGVARVATHGTPPDGQVLTDVDNVVGTPGYMAPEVALHGVQDEPRSDFYSLGVIAYEALAGRPPFSASTPTALMLEHATKPVPALPSTVPLALAALVLRLLDKDPRRRPADAHALLADLSQVQLDDDAAMPTLANTVLSLPSPAPTGSRLRVAVLFGVLLGLVAAFAFVRWRLAPSLPVVVEVARPPPTIPAVEPAIAPPDAGVPALATPRVRRHEPDLD